jgi:putative membrane protein
MHQAQHMFTAALVLAGLAALLHVYIWVLESFRWEASSTRRTFRLSREEARVTKPLAFNQGFYNLFLAIVTGAGIVAAASGRAVAVALLCAGVGSMLAAAVVLVASDRSMVRAAATQGTVPLLALLALGASAL